MAGTNAYDTANKLGITNPVSFSGLTTNTQRVDAVINFVKMEESNQSEARFWADKMDPVAKATILVVLDGLKAAIVNV